MHCDICQIQLDNTCLGSNLLSKRVKRIQTNTILQEKIYSQSFKKKIVNFFVNKTATFLVSMNSRKLDVLKRIENKKAYFQKRYYK